MNKEKVLYYCHSLKNAKEVKGLNEKNDESLYQIKIFDQDDKDVILDYLGIPSSNELLKFIVHIYIAK
ncbi:MAG: hypothetical protein JXB17_06525 [Bacteroidales bacterium]|nr:hypothetical protein [Bacteroidales bacterium]